MNKKSSKKLAAAIVAGLTMATAATAMAAVNPFTDVPAKHWAYGAVSKLAADGIIDGYGDGTFRGDRTMTRYEMAQIVGKAMAHEDKANAEQKAMIDKLAKEFSDELDALGVRMTKLENKVGNITWSGQVREWYEKNEDADSTNRWTRLLLFAKAPLTNEITFNARMYAESPWGESNGYNAVGDSTGAVCSIDQAYLAGTHKNVSWTFGRQGIMLGQGLIYAFFPNNDGATVTFGSDDTKLTVAAFRNEGIFLNTGAAWGYLGSSPYNLELSVPKLNIIAANLTHKATKDLDLSLAYAKNNKHDLNKMTNDPDVNHFLDNNDLIDTWALGAVYRGIKNVTVTAEYGENRSDVAKAVNSVYTGDDSSAKAWVAKAQYKGADWATPHSYGFWVGYRKADPGFFGRNGDYIWETGSGSWDELGGFGMNNVKGLNYGVDYTVFKNAILTLEYFDLEYDSDLHLSPNDDKRSFVAQLRYMF